MKTVTGKIIFSASISVSKAAKIIAKFAAADNGSSQAVSAYLRRASASFNELKQLHKELRRSSESDRKHKKSRSEITVEGAGESSLEPSVFNFTPGAPQLSQEASHGYGDSEGRKHKDKKKKEKCEAGNIGDDGDRIVIEEHSERKKHKKQKKKSDRKIENFQKNGVNIQEGKLINEEQKEGKKKKRKSTEIEDGSENNSSLEPRKKKKKKKKLKNEVDN